MQFRLPFVFPLLLAILSPSFAWADGSEVAVVYNTAVPASKFVADYYAKARQIPGDHVFGLKLGTGLEISRVDFHLDLQEPLADKLESLGLWKFGDIVIPYADGHPKHTEHRIISSKIRYLVLCYGVPLRITEDPGLHEYGESNLPAEFRLNTAAVDSELAWLPSIKMAPMLAGPLPNWVYCHTNRNYLHPTNGILMVARLDGPSPKIACGLVDKAMVAERDGLWGRGYFDTRGLAKSDNYHYGDELISGAAEISKKIGFDTIIDTNGATFPASFPLSHIALYFGWYDWNASGPFTLPKVEFMPGAIAYHLHSFSAADVRSFTNNWVGPLLAKGATCTMGCVSEPYLQFTPNLIMFMEALGNGWSFGEAAWAAQPALSWQTTVVGDPLYRPFFKPPLEIHAELQKRHSPSLEWSYQRLMNLDHAHGAPAEKLAGFLSQLPETSHSAVLTEKLAEFTDDAGKPAAAIDYYQQALKLDPSPQQKIEIRLTLGAKLTAQNRIPEACENYRQLLVEVPDYAGKTNIEATLTQLGSQPLPVVIPNKP